MELWILSTPCIHHVFCFLYSDALTSGTLLTLEDSLSQDKPVPRDSKQLAFKCAFQMQTNQSRAHAPVTSFIGLSCCVFLSYYPSHPRVRYQTTREASMPQSLLKLLTLVNLEPV